MACFQAGGQQQQQQQLPAEEEEDSILTLIRAAKATVSLELNK